MNAEILKALLRHILGAGGAAVAAQGAACQPGVVDVVASMPVDSVAGGVAAAVAVAWSVYDKRSKP